MLATSAWCMFWVWVLSQPRVTGASDGQLGLMVLYSVVGVFLALQWDTRQK